MAFPSLGSPHPCAVEIITYLLTLLGKMHAFLFPSLLLSHLMAQLSQRETSNLLPGEKSVGLIPQVTQCHLPFAFPTDENVTHLAAVPQSLAHAGPWS